jgi:hypothetical protein
MLFEIRVAGNLWFLDSFHFSATANRALMNRNSFHPLGAWYTSLRSTTARCSAIT